MVVDLLQRAKELEQQAKNESYLLGKNKLKPKMETLFEKSKKLQAIDDAQKKRFLFLLDKERQILEEKSKDSLNLLQKSLEDGVQFMKLGKKKKHIPVEVIEVSKLEEDGEIPKYEKIIYYAEKYRIPFVHFGVKKSYGDLEKEIQKFEKKYLKQIIYNGKDKKYGEYGLFIKKV